MTENRPAAVRHALTSFSRRAWRRGGREASRVLDLIGVHHSEARLAQDAERYWAANQGDSWQNFSHWRGGSLFQDHEAWASIGVGHLALYERLKGTAGDSDSLGRVVEWGAGGGANAVSFAPRADEFIAVDIVSASLEECERQVKSVCETPFVKVLAELAHPERAAAQITTPCHLFLCVYVLEIVPDQRYGLDLMRLAYRMLGPGGRAFVQIKYETKDTRTRSRKRNYAADVAGTTFRIEDFWEEMENIGFRPEAVSLVPRNSLDERYAYFLLSRP